jgi:hypothetical protein
MTVTKLVLFAAFAAMLSVLSLSPTHADTRSAVTSPSIVMQQACPDGKVWSDDKQRCVPERPRGSY